MTISKTSSKIIAEHAREADLLNKNSYENAKDKLSPEAVELIKSYQVLIDCLIEDREATYNKNIALIGDQKKLINQLLNEDTGGINNV